MKNSKEEYKFNNRYEEIIFNLVSNFITEGRSSRFILLKLIKLKNNIDKFNKEDKKIIEPILDNSICYFMDNTIIELSEYYSKNKKSKNLLQHFTINNYSSDQISILLYKKEYLHIMEALQYITQQNDKPYIINREGYFILQCHQNLFREIVETYCNKYRSFRKTKRNSWVIFDKCTKHKKNNKEIYTDLKNNANTKTTKTDITNEVVNKIFEYVKNNPYIK